MSSLWFQLVLVAFSCWLMQNLLTIPWFIRVSKVHKKLNNVERCLSDRVMACTVHVDRFLNTSLIETWIFVGSMSLPWKRQGSPTSSFDHITTGTWASHTYLQTPAAHEQHPHNYISQLTLSWDGNSNVLPYQLRWDQQEGVTHSGFDLKNQNGSLYRPYSKLSKCEWVSFTFSFLAWLCFQ